MSIVVHVDPFKEAIAKKLSGFNGVPRKEQVRMVLRALNVGDRFKGKYTSDQVGDEVRSQVRQLELLKRGDA